MGLSEPRVRPEVNELHRYIPGKPIEEVERELGLPRIIKLASNENPLGPSPKAIAAAQTALKNAQLYPDDNAYYLKEALAHRHNISEEHFVLGNGGVELIRMAVETFLEPGDEVITGSPTFAIYREDTKQMGGTLIQIPLDASYHFDLDAIEKAITPKTKLIFLCSPNNPTGTVLKKTALESFLNRVSTSIFILLDEAYSDFVQEPNFHNGIDYVRQGLPVLVLRTLSKAYGLAGMRVGYGITSPQIANELNRVRTIFNVSSVAQAAAIAALSDHDHYEKTRKLIWKEKSFLTSQFQNLGIPYIPTESNFFAIQVGDDRKVFDLLLHQGIITRPGTPLGMPGWIRVSIGTHEDNVHFTDALGKIKSKCQT